MGNHALHSRVRYTADHRFQLYAVGYPTPKTGWHASGRYSFQSDTLHVLVQRVSAVGVEVKQKAFANQVLAREFAKPEDNNLHWLDANHFEVMFQKGRTKPLLYTRVD